MREQGEAEKIFLFFSENIEERSLPGVSEFFSRISIYFC
jgi:hypothetical protein